VVWGSERDQQDRTLLSLNLLGRKPIEQEPEYHGWSTKPEAIPPPDCDCPPLGSLNPDSWRKIAFAPTMLVGWIVGEIACGC
jgi:hypothetical protein